MKNNINSIAISSMYVQQLWKTQEKDLFDLIRPFVLQVIIDNFQVGQCINQNFIVDKLEEDYYFQDFPLAVLKKILKRIKQVQLSNSEYCLKNEITSDENFGEKLIQSKEKMFEIVKAYCEFEAWDFQKKKEQAEDILLKFFEKYGYLTVKSPTNIIDNIQEKKLYRLGKFILEHFENKTHIFDYILQAVEGFMLMQIIYFADTSQLDTRATFRGVKIYLDTAIILRVLGYKTKEENKMAKTLIRYLNNLDADIVCFEHNFQEVEESLRFYKSHIYGRRNPTLEFFDDNGYDEEDVEYVIQDLRGKFRNSGITIKKTPSYHNEKNIDYSEAKLHNFLEKNLNYSAQTLENDIKSITAIRRIRKIEHLEYCDKVENSGAIFVTNNTRLVYYANHYFSKDEDHIGKPNFNVAISDINLTTLVWIKRLTENNNLPKLRLVENAHATIYPNSSLINSAIEAVDKLKHEHSGEKDQLADIIYYMIRQKNTREELMDFTQGSPDKVNEFIRKKYEMYEEAIQEKEEMKKEFERAKQDKKQTDKNLIEANKEKEKFKQYEMRKFYNKISKSTNRKFILLILMSIVTCSLIIYFVVNILVSQLSNYAVMLAIGTGIFMGIVFLVLDKIYHRKFTSKLYSYVEFKTRSRMRRKEIGEGNPIFSDIDQEKV